MKKERLRIPADGAHTLAAQLDSPSDGLPIAYAVFAHCFTCTKNLKSVGKISQSLVEAGIAVLRFDFTGIGDSGGDFSETGFETNISDLIAVAGYLEQEYQAPALLIGHSLGGAAVIEAASVISSCKAIATIAAPYEPGDVAQKFLHKRQDVEQHGFSEINIGGVTFKITSRFFDAINIASLENTLRTLNKALLVMHSVADETVDISHATKIFTAATHPKSFVSLDDMDHLMSRKQDALYVGAVIATWVRRYI